MFNKALDLTAFSLCSKMAGELELVLERLLCEKRDFKEDNPKLIKLIESDWEKRVWEIFV